LFEVYVTSILSVIRDMCQSAGQTVRARRNTRTDELTALIEDEGWHLINAPDIATYHYRNGTGSSVLDLTIALPAVAREVTNWAMDDENPTGSDHEVI
jgi:hypothetical protein